MEKERGHMTERMLDLTLEIIYLLTGENYIAFKLSNGLVAPNLRNTQSPFTQPPPPALTPETSNDKKIQEVTNKIIELLTGEVPIRCQDVTVSFSMEEWDQRSKLHEVKELRPNSMESRNSVQTPGSQGTPSKLRGVKKLRPNSGELRNSVQTPGSQETPPKLRGVKKLRPNSGESRNSDGNKMKGNVKMETEEPFVISDEPCKEEDITPEISTATQHYRYNARAQPLPSPDGKIEDDDDLTSDSAGENPMTPNFHPALSSHSTMHMGCFSDDPVAHHASQNQGETLPCPECGGCFSQRAGVNVNTGDTLYSCSECGKCYTPKTRLADHIRTNTGTKPYTCPQCGKGFPSNAHLVIHYRLHTGEKPYSCSDCGKRFHQKSNLNHHQVIHSGEKPFSCLECGKRFLRKADLVTHQKTHSGLRPYSCPHCGKCYRNPQSDVKAEEEVEEHVRIKEEEVLVEISTGDS
ncbi:PREDICTED: oocyte zinc finger protein XlCOF7.1-like [Nanorana parkeri]|uniref:oocyte zinc finger protein XlCOF7.1-like n=1 Tax=Nanorana parkeri TaxID=125878 RepID=UPI000854700E|nr:PREDICTED: oocyte zinc finger protein XlCOF7.1-like [Nanorana parkeri]